MSYVACVSTKQHPIKAYKSTPGDWGNLGEPAVVHLKPLLNRNDSVHDSVFSSFFSSADRAKQTVINVVKLTRALASLWKLTRSEPLASRDKFIARIMMTSHDFHLPHWTLVFCYPCLTLISCRNGRNHPFVSVHAGVGDHDHLCQQVVPRSCQFPLEYLSIRIPSSIPHFTVPHLPRQAFGIDSYFSC